MVAIGSQHRASRNCTGRSTSLSRIKTVRCYCILYARQRLLNRVGPRSYSTLRLFFVGIPEFDVLYPVTSPFVQCSMSLRSTEPSPWPRFQEDAENPISVDIHNFLDWTMKLRASSGLACSRRTSFVSSCPYLTTSGHLSHPEPTDILHVGRNGSHYRLHIVRNSNQVHA